ncbi:MAG: phosphatase PAP2 family protein [Rhodanobacter sp.]
MNPIMMEWIAAHALLLWALLLLLAMMIGDLAWQHNVRWHRRTAGLGQIAVVMRWQVGVFLLLALLLLFAAIVLALFGRYTALLAGFDTALAESLHNQLPLPVLRMVAKVTHLGDRVWLALAAAIVLIVLLLRRHGRLALAWSIALLGIVPINGSLKAALRRVRPLHDHGFIIEPGWSFPSGHAFGAVVFYGMLAYSSLRLSPRCHRAIIAAAVLLIGVVGISRILLQVHYFSDVLAGYTLGAAWLVLCIGIMERLQLPPRRTLS